MDAAGSLRVGPLQLARLARSITACIGPRIGALDRPIPPIRASGRYALGDCAVAGRVCIGVRSRRREARFPAAKSIDTFDFTAIPSVNKMLVLELARCEFMTRRDTVIALGNSGTGKTHAALALGLAACQRGFSVAFYTAAGLVHTLNEARDERRLLKLQAQLQAVKLLIIDELGYVPLSRTGAELLFDVFSQRHERDSTIVTSNLPFDEWTSVMGSERLTGALLDRLTHHVHILEFNGDSFRLKHSKARRKSAPPAETPPASELGIDPETDEILEA